MKTKEIKEMTNDELVAKLESLKEELPESIYNFNSKNCSHC